MHTNTQNNEQTYRWSKRQRDAQRAWQKAHSSAVVYRITIGDTHYIGSCSASYTRRAAHLSYLRNGKHYNHDLQAAFEAHGADAFVWDELYQSEDLNELRAFEIMAIRQCNNCNRQAGCEYRWLGDARIRDLQAIIDYLQEEGRLHV